MQSEKFIYEINVSKLKCLQIISVRVSFTTDYYRFFIESLQRRKPVFLFPKITLLDKITREIKVMLLAFGALAHFTGKNIGHLLNL